MGYSTDFTGILWFTSEPSVAQLTKLKTLFDEDCRDHPEWESGEAGYIDLEITNDFKGIKWNGAEKTRGLVDSVNIILSEMKKLFPNFGLSGEMEAQGEEGSDQWILCISESGEAFSRQPKKLYFAVSSGTIKDIYRADRIVDVLGNPPWVEWSVSAVHMTDAEYLETVPSFIGIEGQDNG